VLIFKSYFWVILQKKATISLSPTPL